MRGRKIYCVGGAKSLQNWKFKENSGIFAKSEFPEDTDSLNVPLNVPKW